ncbi:MAG: DNA mismatch repair endonuclease MutL [Planctomycetes bacterium]|nr:DNA mismatch repair endonuclease MutL [Planctomycetota bacterium]
MIRVLPPSLANRIAAGEVVERPASVVKELVENALDAGATRVRVDLEDAGRALVRVVDDGGGIPAGELGLALAPHATSKLLTDEDLFRVRTLGFRGEALASIAAVSRLRLTSRTEGVEAARIEAVFGEPGPVRPAGAPRGTEVEVRDLFQNTPARRKFLRSEATELKAATEAVLRLALGFPEVGFELRHGARQVFEAPAAADEGGRLAALFRLGERGSFAFVEHEEPDLRVRLYAAPSSYTRASTDQQYVFLNRRHVRDRNVQHAVNEAYRRFLEPRRFPAAFCYIELDPAQVDVNVHPAKLEVRFQEPRRVHGVVMALARRALGGVPLTDLARDHESGSTEDWPPQREGTEAAREHALDLYRPAGPSPGARASGPAEGGVMQVHRSYIVHETPEGLEVVDQHALHERVLLEEIRGRLAAGSLPSQRLLVGERLEASALELEAYGRAAEVLRRLGFQVRPADDGGLEVQAVPAILGRVPPAELLREVLSRASSDEEPGEGGGGPEAVLERLTAALACRAAVKFHDPLGESEMRELLGRRGDTEGHFACAHGRPTVLAFTLEELERRFHRRGG